MYLIYLRRLIKGITGSSPTATIDTNRLIKKIADGVNLGDPAMPMKDFIERAFYDYYPTINTWSGGTTLEKGETSLTRTLTYSITSPTGGSIASAIITRNDGGAAINLRITGSGTFTGTQNVTLLSDTNCTFTLTVTAATTGNVTTSTTPFTFKNYVYYGVSTIPSPYNEAFIKGLTKYFDTDYETPAALNYTAGSGEYCYFCIPAAFVTGGSPWLDPPYFYVGGFAGGFQVESATISYTYGTNTEDYIIYRSVNPNLGVVALTVSDS